MTGLFDILRSHESRRIALIEALQGQGDVVFSYGALVACALALREKLDALGAPDDAPVVVLSSRPLHQAVAIVAGMAAGAVISPLNPALRPAALNGALQHAQPALIIVEPGCVPPDARCTTIGWDDLFGNIDANQERLLRLLPGNSAIPRSGGLLIYTSGTTGAPKGVLLNCRHIRANVGAAIERLGYQPGWISGSLLPRFHTFTLISDIFPMLFLGGHTVLVDAFELPTAPSAVAAFKRHGVRSYSAAPIILEALCALRAWSDVPTLRFAVAGAAPLKEKTRLQYHVLFGHPIVPCYGLSETTCFATISPADAQRCGTVGLPAGIEICVFDERGQAMESGVTGELAMRGPSVIRDGYFRDVAGHHAQAFTADGWFLSGDIGHLDADGYVVVTGRKKNMVIRGGEKIYLEDLDRCLDDCADITDCASIVEYRPGDADRALTFIVAADDAPCAVERVEQHVRAVLGPRHVPDQMLAVERIPRTRTGKVSHPELMALVHGMEDRR